MNPNWKDKNYSFFAHKECEYFPCHKCSDTDNFSCLFCYCPLYLSGDKCGGNFKYTNKGIKDCTDCTIPHQRDNYGLIVERFVALRDDLMTKDTTGGDSNGEN